MEQVVLIHLVHIDYARAAVLHFCEFLKMMGD